MARRRLANPSLTRRLLGIALAAALGLSAAPGRADDTSLFTTTSVSPNVLVLLDNSASMNSIIWHPAYDPTQTYSCNPSAFPSGANQAFNPTDTIYITQDQTWTVCNRTRTIFHDPKASPDPIDGKRYTHYSGAYLNWLFSAEADAAYAEITQTNNGFPSSCVGGTSFAKYQRTRMNVAKEVLKNVVCQVNLVGNVRFGIAIFRNMDASMDPNGGYVLAPVDATNSTTQADLVSAIQSVSADTYTPLAEALFQLYTYFMPRTTPDLPLGVDGTTKFPLYQYNTSTSGVGGGFSSNGNGVPPDPVQYSCQKNFVIIVTDGDPTKDDFTVSTPTDTAQGFTDFQKLIGDYNPDGQVESQPNVVCAGCQTTLYLDDVAMYMENNDFRPDMKGDQVIDTYTVGFTTTGLAQQLLSKTAQVGNGLFFQAKDETGLANAIVNALTDIIEKAQSFTAATVPASRTAAGDHLYVSLFTPSGKTPYWDGRLRSYELTVDGQVHDKNGNCALDDPSGNCLTGAFLPPNTNPPFWDAGNAMPLAAARNLSVSRLNSVTGNPEVVDFNHISNGGPLSASDLGVVFPPASPYPGSTATTDEELTAEIIASVRGCDMGTGANGVPCAERANRLSDIFHSNPVVVGSPSGYHPDQTYKDWVTNTTLHRDRVIYAGSNGGFFHGFDAGTWNATATPPTYTAGTGAERFGFMPWTARKDIADLPNDTGSRDFYYVDGSPSVADVWLYSGSNFDQPAPTTYTQWRTVMVGGMRQGGHSYYALDVTKPGATSCDAPATGSGYPCYMWEFPKENDLASYQSMMGQTWGDPIITKIKLDVNGTKVDRWVAVVTGGYDPTADPNDHASYQPLGVVGRSVWIIDLSNGRPLAVRHFDNSSGGCSAAYDPANPEKHMCYGFAATPAVYDVDGDGYADLIVAADLGGQLWKWVIKAPGYDPNNTSKTLADNNTAWPFRKFFAAPIYQASSTGPKFYKSFFHNPAATIYNGTLWYAIGTGERNQLLYMSDPSTTDDNNRFYSIKDGDPFDANNPTTVIAESDLTDISNVSTCGTFTNSDGFYFVGAEGEKWVTNVDIFNYWVLASSYIPVPSTDPCDLGGASYLYAFRIYCGEGFFTDPNTGTPVRQVSLGGGLPTDPKVSIATGQGGQTRVIISKQGGEIMNVDFGNAFGPGIGVFYWRELQN